MSFTKRGTDEAWVGAGSDALLEPGVYTLEDLRIFGRKQGWCPYFLARHMLAFANVVVYNYQYMLDPKVSVLGGLVRGFQAGHLRWYSACNSNFAELGVLRRYCQAFMLLPMSNTFGLASGSHCSGGKARYCGRSGV